MLFRWRLPALLIGLIVAGCGGSRPDPTLDDYSFGVQKLVEGLEPLFLGREEGERRERGTSADGSAPTVAGKSVLNPPAPLRELAERWRTATRETVMARARMIDFHRVSTSEATARVEIRLWGFASQGSGERLATVAVFDLSFLRRKEGEGTDAGWVIREARALSGSGVLQRGRPHLFEEATVRGIEVMHETIDPVETTNFCIPATHHHPGVLLVDVDGDGALDIMVPGRRPRLFLNGGGGHFRDATKGSGLDTLPEMEASGGLATDVDGDGLPDLFLTNHFSPCVMLKNMGGGRFRDVTREWGLAGLSGPYTSAVFFDADRDGRVDLFIACYGDARRTGPAYDGFNGERDRFFRSVDKGGVPFFVDETTSAGLGDVGWGFAASACDFDDDGDDDLYVANDFGLHSFFENRSTPGHPFFVNIAKESGTEDEGYGMGVTWGDYDGDGRWDVHVADYWTPYRWILRDRRWPMPPLLGAGLVRPFMAKIMARRSRGDGLFRNLGSRRFARTSEEAGVADGGWAWGTEFVDLDGKGREDLVVVNGMYRATTGVDDEVAFWNGMGREGVNFHDGVWGGIDFGGNGMASHSPKKLFWNRGDGTFEERAFVEGFDTLEDTRGLAYGDLDGDGAPEIVVSCFRGPVLLYMNGWTERNGGGGRIRVRLAEGPGFNRDALGAVVRLWASGKVQMREVRAGSSYLSQSSRELLFGIGKNETAEEIEVRWPDGKREVLRDVPRGTRVDWVKGYAPRFFESKKGKGEPR